MAYILSLLNEPAAAAAALDSTYEEEEDEEESDEEEGDMTMLNTEVPLPDSLPPAVCHGPARPVGSLDAHRLVSPPPSPC